NEQWRLSEHENFAIRSIVEKAAVSMEYCSRQKRRNSSLVTSAAKMDTLQQNATGETKVTGVQREEDAKEEDVDNAAVLDGQPKWKRFSLSIYWKSILENIKLMKLRNCGDGK